MTADPLTLEAVLSDALLERVASVLTEFGEDTAGEYLDDDLLQARLELMSALAPWAQAIRADERRKVQYAELRREQRRKDGKCQRCGQPSLSMCGKCLRANAEKAGGYRARARKPETED